MRLSKWMLLLVYLTTVAAYYRKWTSGANQLRGVATATSTSTERPRLRHASYDRVMKKLDDMRGLTRARGRVATTTTTTTTESGLFEDYDDEDEFYDDELEEGGSWKSGEDAGQKVDDYLQSDEEDNDYEEDDPETSDYAEEETEKPEKTTARRVSPLTEYKWERLGSRSKVEETRSNVLRFDKANDAVWAAVQHSVLMNNEAKCHTPSPKVIPVKSVHPDNTKEYTPHCTILHRCAEDTGCCSSDALRCAPKRKHQVHLFFYTRTLGVRGAKVERLTFFNHTECACVHKSRIAIAEEVDDEEEDTGISVRSAEETLPAAYLRRCRCPKLYTPRLLPDMSCSCDCNDADVNCEMMKKGVEHFSLMDRKCIVDNHCTTPKCLYGNYLRNEGKCPSARLSRRRVGV